jgi:hypothetical protein
LPSNAFQDDFWPVGPFQYQRHQPENTLLYQLVKAHWPQFENMLSEQGSFSLHAGVACKSNQRKKLEHLCRYITRPAIAEQRLSVASNGNVIVALKTPYDDGTSHVVLSPMEL